MRAEKVAFTMNLSFGQRTAVEKQGYSLCTENRVEKTMYMAVGRDSKSRTTSQASIWPGEADL